MARAMTTTGSRPAPGRPQTFDHRAIEPRWQQRWEADRLYEADVDQDAARPKHYALVMFPYTSGDLHLGHWWNFALADVHTRYKRMQGFNVLFPPGFDAFGLPAEGAAIKSGTANETRICFVINDAMHTILTAASPAAPSCWRDNKPQAGHSARRCARWRISRWWSCGPCGCRKTAMFCPTPHRPAVV